MCDFTHVRYRCCHTRYTVRAWCMVYQKSHIRCPLNVIAIESRIAEDCGDCRNRSTVTRYKGGTAGQKLASLFPRRPDLLMDEVTER
ncbi:hypothetical protein B5807_09690 [Epicoccum nigrum]|uniref:Uncharacterized protein n=1 Tax=Epicoccum nigrum TaxID=105696 RepID=A0A1Y2LPA4_EPING|nr:hypothetical protein B5807_09690 [Epicoccum nigrum]